MRAVIPCIITVLLVSVLAPVVGLYLFGATTGTPQLAGSRDLAGVPFLFYAARFALPVALPAGVLAAILATLFSYSFGRQTGVLGVGCCVFRDRRGAWRGMRVTDGSGLRPRRGRWAGWSLDASWCPVRRQRDGVTLSGVWCFSFRVL